MAHRSAISDVILCLGLWVPDEWYWGGKCGGHGGAVVVLSLSRPTLQTLQVFHVPVSTELASPLDLRRGGTPYTASFGNEIVAVVVEKSSIVCEMLRLDMSSQCAVEGS